MTRKTALYVLGVIVLTGSMAVGATADYRGMSEYGPADSSVSAQPEQGVEQSAAGEIREPVEAGAVPNRPESSSSMHSKAASDEPTVEFGGQSFRETDLGP